MQEVWVKRLRRWQLTWAMSGAGEKHWTEVHSIWTNSGNGSLCHRGGPLHTVWLGSRWSLLCSVPLCQQLFGWAISSIKVISQLEKHDKMSQTQIKIETYKSSAPTIQTEVIHCEMSTISVNIAVTMLDTWPCHLNLIDLGTKLTLGIAIAMNRGDLETSADITPINVNTHICFMNRFFNWVRRKRLWGMSGKENIE